MCKSKAIKPLLRSALVNQLHIYLHFLGPDGTTFSFTSCSLSFNGTNPTRGQLPQILYFSSPQESDVQDATKSLAETYARRTALSMTSAIVKGNI